MRVHMSLDQETVRKIDERAGARGRRAYVEEAVLSRLEQDERWEKIWSAVGSIPDHGHHWDPDVATWVHDQRRTGRDFPMEGVEVEHWPVGTTLESQP